MKGPHEKHLRSIKATRDGLRLFRCRSSSRSLRTFAISSGGSLLVYLAAQSEQETQNWIQLIRCGLWPPIDTFTDSPYDVSIIDNEKTFSFGLLGLYGRLVKTADNMINIIHPHWQGTLLRWKQEDVVNIALVRKVGGDNSSAGVFKITLRSLNKEERSLHFYSSKVLEAMAWIQSERSISEESTVKGDLSKNILSNMNSSQHSEISSFRESSYAAINKSPNITTEDELTKSKLRDNSEKPPEASTLDGHLFVNLSSDILDSSINSARMFRDKTKEQEDSGLPVKEESDSDSSSDLYEHVYEEMSQRSESIGAYTLYEEINDAECEYVPPLPPQLPKRPIQNPNSLRLLKLSESVAEALKIAEDTLKQDEEQIPSILKKRSSKKSKSLRSRPHKELSSQNSQENCVLKKASSESDLTDSILSKTDIVVSSNCNSKTNNSHLPEDFKIKNLDGCDSLEKMNVKHDESDECKADFKLKRKILDTNNFPKSVHVKPKEVEEDYIDMKQIIYSANKSSK